MALVRCEASEAWRPGYMAVEVASIEGHREYLTIEERFLVERDGQYYLPVMLIGKDPRHNTALVQLPMEADSGANRVWVSANLLAPESHEVAV